MIKSFNWVLNNFHRARMKILNFENYVAFFYVDVVDISHTLMTVRHSYNLHRLPIKLPACQFLALPSTDVSSCDDSPAEGIRGGPTVGDVLKLPADGHLRKFGGHLRLGHHLFGRLHPQKVCLLLLHILNDFRCGFFLQFNFFFVFWVEFFFLII